MKSTHAVVFFALLIMSGNICFSQISVDAPYEIGTWPGFRSGAVSYTFDDGCPNQFPIAIPMFNEFGFPLTLFTVTGWGPDWTVLQNAASQGHEIACHTVNHQSLTAMESNQQYDEMKNARDQINSHITGSSCVTIAYPFCHLAKDSIVSQLFIGARGCSGAIEPKTPANMNNISSIICGDLGSVKKISDFTARANTVISNGGWCVYLIHGIDNDGGYSPLSSDTLRASLEYLDAERDRIWVATFGNAVRYIKERNSTTLTTIATLADSITLEITDTLDDATFNYPITVRRPLPQDWTTCGVRQQGKDIASQLVEDNSVTYIMFDAVPDNGYITLYKNGATGYENVHETTVPSRFLLYQNYPNPFNPETEIAYQLPVGGFLSLKVFDTLGKEVMTLVNEYKVAGTYNSKLRMHNSAFQSGVYFYRISTEDFCQTKKMLLLK